MGEWILNILSVFNCKVFILIRQSISDKMPRPFLNSKAVKEYVRTGMVEQVKCPGGSTSSMIFHLRQHPEEFKKYEEETEIRDIANIKKTEAKKRATLELGIGSSSSSSSGLKQPKVNDAFKKLNKYDINGAMQASSTIQS